MWLMRPHFQQSTVSHMHTWSQVFNLSLYSNHHMAHPSLPSTYLVSMPPTLNILLSIAFSGQSMLLYVICVETCIPQPSKYWGPCWMAQSTSMWWVIKGNRAPKMAVKGEVNCKYFDCYILFDAQLIRSTRESGAPAPIIDLVNLLRSYSREAVHTFTFVFVFRSVKCSH